MARTFFGLLASGRLLQDYLLLEDHNVDAPRHSASNPTATGVPLDDLFWPLGILTDGWEDCERFAMYMFSALGIAVIEKIRAIDNLDFKRSAGLSAESKRCRNIRHGTFGKLPSEIIGMITTAYGETVQSDSFYTDYMVINNTALQYLRTLRLVNKELCCHATRQLFRHVRIDYDERKSKNCHLVLHPNNPFLRYAQHVRSVTIRVGIWTDPEDNRFGSGDIDSQKSLLERFTMFMYGFPHLERLEVDFTTIGSVPPLVPGRRLYPGVLFASFRALAALLCFPVAKKLCSLWLRLPHWFTFELLEKSCLAFQEETGRTLRDTLPRLTEFGLIFEQPDDYQFFEEWGVIDPQSQVGLVFMSQLVRCDVLHLSFGDLLIPRMLISAFGRLKELSLEEIEIEQKELVAIIKRNRKTLSSVVLFDIALADTGWEEVFVTLGTLPHLTSFGLGHAGYNFDEAGESIEVYGEDKHKVADLNSMNIRDYHALGDLQRLVVERRKKANLDPIPPDDNYYPGYRRMNLSPLATLLDSKEETLEGMRHFLGLTFVEEDADDN